MFTGLAGMVGSWLSFAQGDEHTHKYFYDAFMEVGGGLIAVALIVLEKKWTREEGSPESK